MTLGKLIDALSALPGDRKISGVGGPDSYRGYYRDLAFEPDESERTVAEVLQECSDCMGREFTGYKGGEFLMGERTPVWIAEYGSSGERIMSLDTTGDVVRTELRAEDSEDGS